MLDSVFAALVHRWTKRDGTLKKAHSVNVGEGARGCRTREPGRWWERGTSVKMLVTGRKERRSFPSGRDLTPERMVAGVKSLANGWTYDVVLGGGNAKQLKKLPPGCRPGDNANAFEGGFRLWKGMER